MAEPKGYAPWKPRGDYIPLLAQVQETIDHFSDYWPVTQRAWLYRLMARHGWTKSMEYPQLNRILVRGRRAGLIPWEAVSGDRGIVEHPNVFYGADHMVKMAAEMPQHWPLDRQAGQARRLVLWIETEGMVPLLAETAEKYGATIGCGKGFDTVTQKYSIAQHFIGKNTTVLHVGDLDRSGWQVWESLDEDLQAFLAEDGGDMVIERIAVLPHHIDEYGLAWESLPPPDGSNHGVNFPGDRYCQAEAMEPADLIALIEEAFESHLDMKQFRRMMELEVSVRAEAIDRLSAAVGGQ